VIARYLYETTDFADWLAAKLEEAIEAHDEAFDPRSTRELQKLHDEAEARLAKARANLKLQEEACLAARAAVRAAQRGDDDMVERFLQQSDVT
jgi:hypothetical protein